MGSVQFLKAESSEEKLHLLCSTVERIFYKKARLLICVDNERASAYIDELLWRASPTSLLPHRRASQPCDDYIVISEGQTNLNNAKVLINLRREASTLARSIPLVIEFDDHYSQARSALSREKRALYAQQGLEVVAVKGQAAL